MQKPYTLNPNELTILKKVANRPNGEAMYVNLSLFDFDYIGSFREDCLELRKGQSDLLLIENYNPDSPYKNEAIHPITREMLIQLCKVGNKSLLLHTPETLIDVTCAQYLANVNLSGYRIIYCRDSHSFIAKVGKKTSGNIALMTA